MDEMTSKKIKSLKNWAVFLIIVNTIALVSGISGLFQNLTVDINQQMEIYKSMPESVQQTVRHGLEVSSSPAIISLNAVQLIFVAALIFFLFGFIRTAKRGELPEVTAIYVGFAKLSFTIIFGIIQGFMLDSSFGIAFWTSFTTIIIGSVIGFIIYGLMLSKYNKVKSVIE
ncbi:hypothetical protein SAMN05421767_11627 [Granulicatella balaenopterae]|uniref:Uncharacterized protein n=1 Tax=Granulicatella balaenopterae TaxID=137733 RepID=A0A1H9KZD0_9LACT|nr:hypothetical protein [Granulicatella balaenopterae]SER04506.1 hypothetical protein SAMN05421767_11627 [Granulicatella balaenopterae]